ncbi:MAG: magnesium transporter [Clostridia bacterium]|nr:magnesium transporter [Clostridia bacterium]
MLKNKNFATRADAEIVATALSDFLREKKFADFRRLTEEIPAVDLAIIFEECDPDVRALFFRLLSKEKAAESFVEMPPELQRSLVELFTDRELAELLSEMYVDDTVDLIEEMPAALVKRIIRATDSGDRDTINQILKYPSDSAGAIMTTEYMRLRADMTVRDALGHIRSVALDKETIYTAYITDEKRHLLGVVSAKKLLISDPEVTLSEIMQTSFLSVKTTDESEYVAEKLSRYGLIALPVVDGEGRLVGIVTVDDAMSVLREEREEDFAKMAAVTPGTRPYVRTSPVELFRARIPWLLLLMISATLSGAILNRFEALLPTVLVLFVPMLMDTGGNSGAQVSVTVIRSISLGEIDRRSIVPIILKEALCGLMTGAVLAAVAFAKVLLVDRLIMQNPEVTLAVALAVALALFATVIIAKLTGALLPIAAKGIGLDPAVMASPFITTLVDTVALILYFFIAAALVGTA